MAVNLINMGDEAEHAVWVEAAEEHRVARYNKETNTTMYTVVDEGTTEQEINDFWKEHPGFDPIP